MNYFHPADYHPSLIIATTQRCNFRCKMCYWSIPEVRKELDENDNTMSMALFQKTLEQVAPYCSKIGLTSNGEMFADPLLDQRIPILRNFLKEHNKIRFFPITNGFLLTKEKLIMMFEGVEKVGINVSVDSTDALIYASIRKPGILSRVMENMREIRPVLSSIGVNDVQIQINMVAMKSNVFSIPDMLYLSKELNAALFVDHCEGYTIESLDRESLFNVPVFSNHFFSQCAQLADHLDVTFRYPPPFAIKPREIEIYCKRKKEKKRYCSQLSQEGPLNVLSNGNVYACCSTVLLGNLNDAPFDDIYYSPVYEKYRKAIADGKPLPPCDHCRHLERGNFYLYDESDYQINVPPEKRNNSISIDFEKEGFFDWLSSLSEKQIRSHLYKDYSYKSRFVFARGLEGAIDSEKSREDESRILSKLLKRNATIVLYPAGKKTLWLLKHSFITELQILGISDKNWQKIGEEFCGYPVISQDEIIQKKPDAVIIASNLFGKQIKKDLSFLNDFGIEVIAL